METSHCSAAGDESVCSVLYSARSIHRCLADGSPLEEYVLVWFREFAAKEFGERGVCVYCGGGGNDVFCAAVFERGVDDIAVLVLSFRDGEYYWGGESWSQHYGGGVPRLRNEEGLGMGSRLWEGEGILQ